jgi:glycerate 2-kinase
VEVKKILIAPNSFKESASSVELAELFYRYLKSTEYELIIKPISDGGDGFLDVCKKNYDLELLKFNLPYPYTSQKNLDVFVGYSSKLKSVYIESSDILGLKKIPSSKRYPLNLSSVGLGELLNKIRSEFNKENLHKIIIGIGGTGTIDMGIGALSALGLKLFDKHNNELITVPENFIYAVRIEYPADIYPYEIEIILDVNNPLQGNNGGIKIYGAQKGASYNDLIIIENGIQNILNILELDGKIKSNIFLSGAGGGIPAGLSLFLNTTLISSNDFILNDYNLKNYNDIDFLITGEGKFDVQSFNYNKGTGILLDHFKNTNKIFLICGIIDKSISFPTNVFPIQLLDYFNNSEESVNNLSKGIKLACGQIQSIIS